MASSDNKRAIGVFPDYHTTEKALRKLQDINYAMDHISVIGQDSEYLNRSGQDNDVQLHDLQTIEDDTHADDGAKVGGVTGGAVGGLTGLLVGLGTLAIPGIGPIMLAGVAATAIASTIAGGAIGTATGGLLGGLIGLGIPEDRAKIYNDKVMSGHYLVIVDGTDDDIARVEPILKREDIHEWEVYPLDNRPTTVGTNSTENLDSTNPNRPKPRVTKGVSSGRF
jgi:hypothetical protein